jgi:uncharacterized protein YqjF (DUF2071 family)
MRSTLAKPMAAVFLTADWRSLVMINYAIEAEALAPWLPPGVELDLWQGEAVVSVVVFLFQRCRVFGVSWPGWSNFEEVNLRFYVRRMAGQELRRGVVFIKEIVPSRIVALAARTFYNERYVAMPMRHRVEPGRAEFAWRRRGKWEHLAAITRGEPAAIARGGEEEFIFEHYWGYVGRRDGGTTEYAVEHPAWRVWPAESAMLECDPAALYGPDFTRALRSEPRSAFVAEGSAVKVRRGVRIA